MHMADALVSPLVAGVAGVVSGTLLIVAAKKVKKDTKRENIIPLMGVMGAFIFAAQMINFAIPGTGSSGHIVGGVLLATVLGPWAAFITLSSVLVVQCLLFADGGLMAIGCNIINMCMCACLVAYPLIYRNLIRYPASMAKILWVSVLTCVVGLQLGAFFVTVETVASGITALPFDKFLLFMQPIHLAIGIGEGLATASVVYFMQKYKPELLVHVRREKQEHEVTQPRFAKAILIFAAIAVVLGLSFNYIASSDPDGLEWSIARVMGEQELTDPGLGAYKVAEDIQNTTALMPDYNTTFSGIIGGILVVVVTWVLTGLIQGRKKTITRKNSNA